jgi:hypothetical protein
MRRLVVAVGLGVLLLAAPAANGAVVGTRHEPGMDDPHVEGYDEILIEDRRGERNDLEIQVVEVGYRARIIVHERGRPALIARRGCTRRSRRTVVCRTPGAFDVTLVLRVNAGPRDDVVRCRGARVNVLVGGPGDDRLMSGGCGADMLGGTGDDLLIGDRHRQWFFGDAGRDTIRARGGRDLIYGEGFKRGLAADVLDGGPGVDVVSFDDREVGVYANLTSGVGPEGDRLVDIESASGTRAEDILIGDNGSNRLRGGGGVDRIVGRGGKDRLDGGTKLTTWADGGDDVADRFGCGAGRDLVLFPEHSVLPTDCELMVDWSHLDTQLRVPIFPRDTGGSSIAVPAICRMDVESCRRYAVIESRGVELGRSEMQDANKQINWLTVQLRRELPADAPVRIRIHGEDVSGDGFDDGPEGYSFEWRIRCNGPPTCRPSQGR